MGAFWDVGFFNDSLGWIIGDGKILRTINGGATWEIQIQGLQSQFKKLIVLKKEKIAYIFGQDNYQNNFTLLYANLEGITDTNLNGENIPDKIRLFQNYPNPFNLTTSIRFQLPKTSFVKLTIYNLLGQEKNILINDKVDAGMHEKIWNASGYSSGVYIVKFITENYTKSIKIILVK